MPEGCLAMRRLWSSGQESTVHLALRLRGGGRGKSLKVPLSSVPAELRDSVDESVLQAKRQSIANALRGGGLTKEENFECYLEPLNGSK